MDITFFNPFSENAYGTNKTTIESSLRLGYLAVMAEQNGSSCQIIDANVLHLKLKDVIKEIKKT